MDYNISNREREVLHLIAYEHSTKQIAGELFISHHTVDSHRKNLMAKLDVKNVAGLVRKGLQMKIIYSFILLFALNMGQSQNELEFRTDGIVMSRVNSALVVNPVKGQVVFDTIINEMRYYNGTTWEAFDDGSGGGDFSNGGDSVVVDRRLGNKSNLDLSIITDDSVRIHINKDGKVGVGTDNPTSWLHIVSDSASFRVDDENGGDLSPFIIDKNGDVGIGQVTPIAKLNVINPEDSFANPEDMSKYQLYLSGSSTTDHGAALGFGNGLPENIGASIIFQDKGSFAKGDLTFWTKSSEVNGDTLNEVLRMTNEGKVGIGTPEPDEQLEITANFAMPETDIIGSDTVGVILSGDKSFIHSYGSKNTYMGEESGSISGSSAENTAFGYNTLKDVISGSSNTAVGNSALKKNSLGGSNTAIGAGSLSENLSGTGNTAVGQGTLVLADNNDGNTAVGNNSLKFCRGSNNTAIGINTDLDPVGGFWTNSTAIGANTKVGASHSMVLGDSVHVGIGDITPDALLEISSFRRPSDYLMISSNFYSDGDIMMVRSNGFVTFGTTDPGTDRIEIEGSSEEGSSIALNNNASTSSSSNHSHLEFRSEGNIMARIRSQTDDSSTGDLRFVTANSGIVSTKMLVEGGGNVGIGELSPAEKLDVNGNIKIGNAGSNGCIKDNSGTGIVGTCASDSRLKKNIKQVTNVLDKVADLQLVNYEWKADEYKDFRFGSEVQLGLIAQDVELVLPELVATGDDGFKRVKYHKIPLMLLGAVRELKDTNDELRIQNGKLEQRIARLEKLIYQATDK